MENDGEAKNEPSGTFRRQLARPELGSVEVRCFCNKLLPSPFPQPDGLFRPIMMMILMRFVDFQSSGEEAAEPEEDGNPAAQQGEPDTMQQDYPLIVEILCTKDYFVCMEQHRGNFGVVDVDQTGFLCLSCGHGHHSCDHVENN
eukprot:gene3954-15286_t